MSGGCLFYLGHPAHFHLFRHAIDDLRQRHAVWVAIKTKDVLEELVVESKWDFTNVFPRQRGTGLASVVASGLARDLRLLRLTRQVRPRVLVGCAAEITHVGRALGIPSLVFVEDDHDVIPLLARSAFPFATTIVAPEACTLGRWEAKAVRYAGFHGLAYLHPDRFAPDAEVGQKLRSPSERFFVLRLSALDAHHDKGNRGIDDKLAMQIVDKLETVGSVWVSSERPVARELSARLLPIRATDFHHALFFADLCVTDGQSVAKESALLGTPSVRFNDFVGRIGVLNQLEESFGLTFGVDPPDSLKLLDKIGHLVTTGERKAVWHRRRRHMLDKTVDVSEMIIGLVEARMN